MESFHNPIVLQRADPFVFKHTNQLYYFTASYPLYDRIILRCAKHLNDLQDAKEFTIWRKHDHGAMSHLIWAPEIHYVNHAWYIYFAAAPDENIDDDTFNHRIFILENKNEDPLTGQWVEKGELNTGRSTFALDCTSFLYQEKQYLVWAQQDLKIKGHSNLYIAEMKNPWTLKTEPVMLSKPELDWEIKGFWVNEGPAVLIHGKKIFITYSASATGVDYCMGMLTADLGTDLLNAKSWSKNTKPVFQSFPENSQYGPGHNCFSESEDGKQTLLIYHARNYTDLTGDPLYEPNRHARAQVVHWDEFENPVFGHPVTDERWTPTSTEVL